MSITACTFSSITRLSYPGELQCSMPVAWFSLTFLRLRAPHQHPKHWKKNACTKPFISWLVAKFLPLKSFTPTSQLSFFPISFWKNAPEQQDKIWKKPSHEKTLENEARPQNPLQKTTTLHKKSRDLSRPTSSCSNLPFRESLCPELLLKISTIDNDQTFLPRKLTTAWLCAQLIAASRQKLQLQLLEIWWIQLPAIFRHKLWRPIRRKDRCDAHGRDGVQ